MKYLTYLFLFLGFSMTTVAQVSEDHKPMINGTHNALVIQLPDANTKYAKNVWKDFMENYVSKTKKVKGGKEMYSGGANIYSISGTNNVDVYADFEDAAGGARAIVWVDMGDSYLSSGSHKDQYKEAEKFMLRYALEVKISQTNDLLEDEEKKLKKLESEMKGLKKDHEKYTKTIEDCNKKIAKAENDIVANEADQEKTEQNIIGQQEVVAGVQAKLNELKK